MASHLHPACDKVTLNTV